jgi:hypothetical protein
MIVGFHVVLERSGRSYGRSAWVKQIDPGREIPFRHSGRRAMHGGYGGARHLPNHQGTNSMQDDEAFRREADQLVRLYGELVRRLSNRGIRGVDELVALHQQVRAAVDTIAGQEIDTALLQIATLQDRLRLIGRCLVTLSEMKQTLGSGVEGEVLADTTGAVAAGSGRTGFDSSGGH